MGGAFNNKKIIKKEFKNSEPKNYANVYQSNWSEILNVKNIIFTNNLKKRVIYSETKTDSIQNSLSQINSVYYHQKENSYVFMNFTLVFLLFSLALLAFIKAIFGKYLNQLLQAVIYYGESLKLYRDHNTLIDRLFFICNFIFIISGGFFCFYLMGYIKPNILSGHPIILCFYCFSFILGIYFSKFVINKIFGFIIYRSSVFDEFLHNTFAYFKVMGLFLLPIICIIPFVTLNLRITFLVIGVIIIFSLYLISIFRATKIMLQKDILLFYWILYLCTVEFLPIMLLYKFFNNVV